MREVKARDRISVLLAGLVWAIGYGLVWGLAWFGFMRAAWFGALASGNREMPWAEVWTVWAVLNLPLGVATVAYLGRRGPAASGRKTIVAAVLVLWVPMTIGMMTWAWYESLSQRVIAIDSAVNLAALAVASLAGRASLHLLRHRPSSPQSS